MGYIKLQKVLQNLGFSRRKADLLIINGDVQVNNSIVTEPWYDVDEKDVVTVDNQKFTHFTSRMYYYILHKPKGYVSTLKDPKQRNTIGKLISKKLPPEVALKIKPAGRLDKDVNGVLILTNDGQLLNILTSAKFGVEKVYIAKVQGRVNIENISRIKNGIKDNGEFLKCEDIEILSYTDKHSIVKITMIKGKKHEVKRLMAYIGNSVIELTRISHGPIDISLSPKEGDLVPIEGENLKKLIDLKYRYKGDHL
ncbi:MAG: pseudouridine synthase [Fervidobacterium sp.]